MGVDVAPLRRGLLELLAELAHEHVRRAVPAHHRVAPQARVDLLALEHTALGRGQQLDQLEIAPSRLAALPAAERLEAVGADLAAPGEDRLDLSPPGAAAAPAHDALHTCDDFLGGAWLGDPVVGAQAQNANPVGR